MNLFFLMEIRSFWPIVTYLVFHTSDIILSKFLDRNEINRNVFIWQVKFIEKLVESFQRIWLANQEFQLVLHPLENVLELMHLMMLGHQWWLIIEWIYWSWIDTCFDLKSTVAYSSKVRVVSPITLIKWCLTDLTAAS